MNNQNNKLSTRVVVGVVRFYQQAKRLTAHFIAGFFPTSACRHIPSCSQYAIEAIENLGVVKGGWLSFIRLLRCHPWAKASYDPPPIK